MRRYGTSFSLVLLNVSISQLATTVGSQHIYCNAPNLAYASLAHVTQMVAANAQTRNLADTHARAQLVGTV